MARAASKPAVPKQPSVTSVPVKNGHHPPPAANHATESAIVEDLRRQLGELSTTVSDQTVTLGGLERERDFYFGKLRSIEVLCQDVLQAQGAEGQVQAQSVLDILYATEEGFQRPAGEEGELSATNGNANGNGEIHEAQVPQDELVDEEY